MERKIGILLSAISIILAITGIWLTIEYSEKNNNIQEIQIINESINQMNENQKILFEELGIENQLERTEKVEIPIEIEQQFTEHEREIKELELQLLNIKKTEKGLVVHNSIKPLSDQSIDEDVPDSVYSNEEFLASGWSYTTDNSNKIKKAITYIKFNLDDIPQHDPWNTVTIVSSELRLFLQTVWAHNENEQFIITVSSCSNNQWSENSITWNNRVCINPNEITPQDSILIHRSDTPDFFSWNVVNSIQHAKENNDSEITFLVTVFPVETDRVITIEEEEYRALDAGIIWMWSSEKKNVGIDAGPSLDVGYTTLNSTLTETMIIFVSLVSITSFIIPILLWQRKKR